MILNEVEHDRKNYQRYQLKPIADVDNTNNRWLYK